MLWLLSTILFINGLFLFLHLYHTYADIIYDPHYQPQPFLHKNGPIQYMEFGKY